MTVQELIEDLSSGKSPELYQKIAACKTAEEAYETAKVAGLATPKDEAIAAFKKWQKQMNELSDSELEKVAGGATDETDCPHVKSVSLPNWAQAAQRAC